MKNQIIEAYFLYSKKISETLKPGIVALASVYFPDEWPNLITSTMEATKKNFSLIEPFLQLAHSLTERYSYESRSDPLYKEIIIVCDQLHDYLWQLASHLFPLCKSGDQNSLHTMKGLYMIFYNLNFQDLHPKFESNLSNWMKLLGETLKLQHKSPEDKTFECKGAALQSVLLYASKYKEDVENDIKAFSSDIWGLCANAGNDIDSDEVVLMCLKYFRSLILWS